MSVQYESVQSAALYPDVFRVAAPASPVERQVWPRKPGVFIRLAADPAPAGEAGAEAAQLNGMLVATVIIARPHVATDKTVLA